MRVPAPRNFQLLLLICMGILAGGAVAAPLQTPKRGPSPQAALPPSFTPSASPNPVTLAIGGPAQTVTVTTTPDPGFADPSITYAFTGLPNFVVNDGPKTTTITGGYGPVTFNFSLGAGAAAGTYTGALNGTTATGAGKSIPFSVVVQQPDITATFRQPVVSMCDGQTVNDAGQLTPANGYSGTPSVSFTAVPAGITITPAPLKPSPMPPGQTIAFSISAAGATSGVAVLNVSDAAAGINKNIQLTINITPADFTPAVSPPTLSMTAGGSAQNVGASVLPNACFSSNVSVAASGQPPGMTVTPNPASITAPGFTPASIAIQASASVTPGTYPVTFTFTSGGITHSASVQVTVSRAPDFVLNLNPPAITVQAGSSGSTQATITPLNGFSGTVNVIAPAVPGMTIAPATFTLAPGASQPLTVSVAAGTPAGTQSLVFNATSPAVTGTRSATLSLSIAAGPDFTLSVTPQAASVAAGGAPVTATVSAAALNGFSGTVSVSAPPFPGITITPSTFNVTPGGGGQAVTIAAGAAVQPGAIALTFSGTSPSTTGTRTATLALTVTGPPAFILTITPSSLTIPVGGTSSVTAGVTPLNGFSGTVNVTAPSIPGVTFTPSTFTLAPGATQPVSIAVDPAAAPGPRGVATFQGSSPGIANGSSATLTLTISARPDFNITANPPSLSFRGGSSANVTVSAAGVNGFGGAIAVNAQPVAGLTLSPPAFTLTPGSPQLVSISASPAAVWHGPLQVIFSGNAAGIQHEATVIVTVGPPPPVLSAATPPALTAGARSVVIRVAGDFLQPGAQFHLSDASATVEDSHVLTPQLADVRLTVRSDAAPGPRELGVTNPDGGSSATPLVLLVYPPSSIAAPLDVTAAAVVFPARGTFIAPTEAVYARGLLATSGTGTIIGSWQFDGSPFDRFIVNAAGGMPVEVRTNVPIPVSFTGSHSLEMVIETPRHVISPAVEVIDTIDRASQLTLLAPPEGAVLRKSGSLFRWSLVPNCSGFDVEVALDASGDRPDVLTRIVRFHVAAAEWRPTADDLASIGPGAHRWRVRPRCAGETSLEPTVWRRFAILPDHVAITLLPASVNARGAPLVRWNSSTAGVLYRVEFLSPAGETLFSALTAATEYAVPRSFPAGTAVRVQALGPDGNVLGTSGSSPLSRREAHESILLAQQTTIEFGAVQPDDGATIADPQPRISAVWKGAAKPEEVMLLVDNTDMTQVAKVTPTSVAYDSLIALAPGQHSVALGVAGNLTRWSFTVAPPEGAVAAPAAEAPAAPEPRGDWVVAPLGTVSMVQDANNQLRTQISALSDLKIPQLSDKTTADVSVAHDFKNDSTVQESRNWVTEFGAGQGRVSAVARAGFAPPDFLDQAQLMSAGLPRGGAQIKLVVPGGIASYYQTFASQPAGLVTGLFAPDQKIKALAYQLIPDPKWDFRLIGMRVDERADPNNSGGRGKAF
ncbi:MAG TPA: hypothetical protein VKH35_12530, partial [Thermoanaerobaculia bacterium]|nr:hypothetical protein [Thermoanaerobaculia bacterium]